MGGFSLIHWLILGVVVLLLFGGNRFSSMMGDVAKGLKSFKQGMAEDDTGKPQDPRAAPPPQPQPQIQQQQQYAPPPSPPQTIDLTPQQPNPPVEANMSPPRGVPPTDDQPR